MFLVKTKKFIFFLAPSLVLLAVFAIPHHAHAIQSLSTVLADTNDKTGQQVRDVWSRLMDLINIIAILALIIVGIAEILRINVNTYGVKKILPSLVMAILAAQFSFLFCRILIDLASVGIDLVSRIGKVDPTTGSIDLGLASTVKDSLNSKALEEALGQNQWGRVMWFAIMQIIFIIGAVIVLILDFLFIVRIYLVYFMVALSPLAFLSLALPQGKSLFNQWFSQLVKWIFMPVVSVFWLALAGLWMNNVQDDFLLTMVFASICGYLAITTPFKMGGAIMSKWGDLGKKAWGATAGNAWKYTGGAAVNQYKELWGMRAKNWAMKQAGKEGGFNPVRGFMKGGIARGMAIEEEKKAAGNILSDTQGTIMKNDERLKDRMNANRSLGGGRELMEAQILGDYVKTEKGQAWAKNRAEYFDQLQKAQNRAETGYSEGKRDWRKTDDGQKMAQELLAEGKRKETADLDISEMEKYLVISFNNGSGPFAGEENQRLIDDYFNALTTNKTLDEAVSQSSNKKVEAILSDQMFIENIKSGLEDIAKELELFNQEEATDNERRNLLEGESQRRALTTAEQNELIAIEERRTSRDSRRTEIETEKKEMLDAAVERVRVVSQEQKQHHLDGFVVTNADGSVVTNADGSVDVKSVKGFAGSIDMGDETFKKKVGQALMTRAGKLMSIEIKADADKLIDRATVEELSDEIRTGDSSSNPMLKFTREEVEHFKRGQQYKNSPEANRDIEAHMIALAKVAKQNNHPEAESARTAMVSMLDDGAAIKAATLYNKLQERRESSDRIDVSSLSPDQIRDTFTKKMSKRKDGMSTVAFAAVTNQRNIGLSDNPASYLSTSGRRRSSISAPDITDIPQPQFKSMMKTLITAQGEYLPHIAGNKQLVGSLESMTTILSSELNNLPHQLANKMAAKLGPEIGAQFKTPAFRDSLAKAFTGVDVKQMTPIQVAETVGKVMTQHVKSNDPESSADISIDPNETFTTKTMDGTTKEVTLGEAVTRTKNAHKGLETAKVLSMQPKVEAISQQLGHFVNRDAASAGRVYDIIKQELDAEGGISSPQMPESEVISKVNEILRRPEVAMEGSTPYSFNGSAKDAIDFLEKTRDAADAARRSEAAGPGGKIDKDKLQKAAAKMYVERAASTPAPEPMPAVTREASSTSTPQASPSPSAPPTRPAAPQTPPTAQTSPPAPSTPGTTPTVEPAPPTPTTPAPSQPDTPQQPTRPATDEPDFGEAAPDRDAPNND